MNDANVLCAWGEDKLLKYITGNWEVRRLQLTGDTCTTHTDHEYSPILQHYDSSKFSIRKACAFLLADYCVLLHKSLLFAMDCVGL